MGDLLMTTIANSDRGSSIVVEQLAMVRKSFVFHPTSLQLGSGSRTAIVGPNGAGKTTLLRAMSGLMTEHSGRVLVDGIDTRALPVSLRSRIGILPESLRVYGWLSIGEYLDFLARFHPTWSPSYATVLLDRLALSVGMRIGTLSKGMRVKLAFVAAEAFRPSVLILDEPTSGLDPVVRRELMDAVTDAVRAYPQRLVVFSTHLLEDVEWLADRVIVLAGGRVCADLPLDALRARAGEGSSVAAALFQLIASSGGRT